MKLSEAIIYFNKLRKQYGDVEVWVNDDNNGTKHDLEKDSLNFEKGSTSEWPATKDGKPFGTHKSVIPDHVTIY